MLAIGHGIRMGAYLYEGDTVFGIRQIYISQTQTAPLLRHRYLTITKDQIRYCIHECQNPPFKPSRSEV